MENIKNQAELDKALADAGDRTFMLQFTASWCTSCQTIAPKLEEM